MKRIPAKVGTIPMTVDLRGKKKVAVGDRIQWRDYSMRGAKWSGGLITKIWGDPANPDFVFLDRI